MTGERRGLAALASLALVLCTAFARAEDDTAIRTAARFLADRGDEKLHAGQYEQALELFRSAEQLFHAPTLVLAMAQAEGRMGRWTEARRHYRRVIAEELGDDPPDAYVGAKAMARDELSELEPRIPRLSVEVDPKPDHFELRLDGKPFPIEALDEPLFVDPGEHEVLLIADDVVRVETVELEAGDRETIRFDATPLHQPTAPTPKPGERPVPWWAPTIGFTVGVGGLTAGAVTGIMALEDARALKATCTRGTQDCDPAVRPLEGSAQRLATASTVGFVVGAAGIVAGTTLLAVDVATTETALRIGPGYVKMEGRF